MFSIHKMPNICPEMNRESKPTLSLVVKQTCPKISTLYGRGNRQALGRRSMENSAVFFSSQMPPNENLGP